LVLRLTLQDEDNQGKRNTPSKAGLAGFTTCYHLAVALYSNQIFLFLFKSWTQL
jgi:hypothetical protein